MSKRVIQILILALLLPTLAGAAACFQPASTLTVPRETRSECDRHCGRLNMRCSAVVIIMNSAGCVCEPRGTASSGNRGSTAVAGAALIQAAQAARGQQNQQQQYRR